MNIAQQLVWKIELRVFGNLHDGRLSAALPELWVEWTDGLTRINRSVVVPELMTRRTRESRKLFHGIKGRQSGRFPSSMRRLKSSVVIAEPKDANNGNYRLLNDKKASETDIDTEPTRSHLVLDSDGLVIQPRPT